MTREQAEWILSKGSYPFEVETTHVSGRTFESITSVGQKHYVFYIGEDDNIIATTKRPENFNEEDFLSHFDNGCIQINV